MKNERHLQMRFVFLIALIFTWSSSNGQSNYCKYTGYKPIAKEKVDNLLDKQFLCVDSLGLVSLECFERLPLDVEFYRVCYNADSNDLVIIGRTSFPSVGIYLAHSANKIPLDSPINISTGGTELRNAGFFEIQIPLKKGTFLFFESDTKAFAIQRYRIGELLNYINQSFRK